MKRHDQVVTRVTTSINARHMDLNNFNTLDIGSLEVMTDDLIRWRGVQLIIDIIFVSPLRRDGWVSNRLANNDDAVLQVTRFRRGRTYTDLCQRRTDSLVLILAVKTEIDDTWKRLRSTVRWSIPSPSLIRTYQNVECKKCAFADGAYTDVQCRWNFRSVTVDSLAVSDTDDAEIST